MAGDRSNQFGHLTEYKFCRKLSMSISIDSRYCNRFINLGRPIFPLNHSGASAAMVYNPNNIQDRACLGVTLALSPICDPSRINATWFSYCSINHQPSKLYLPSVQSVVIVQTQLQYIQSSRETSFFSALARTSNPPFLLVGCDSW